MSTHIIVVTRLAEAAEEIIRETWATRIIANT